MVLEEGVQVEIVGMGDIRVSLGCRRIEGIHVRGHPAVSYNCHAIGPVLKAVICLMGPYALDHSFC